jgi:hypothetical protein
MAHLTPAERRAFPYSDSIPADVLQRLSRAELADRLVYSRELVQKAARASLPAQQRTIAQEMLAMLRAQPRGATEHDVAQRIAKAASVPDAYQGSAIRRSAQELLTAQPPAPRNPDADLIVKAVAGEDGLMACYDENGCLFGVCQQSELTPVVLPSQVAKARAAAPGRRPPAGHVAAYDRNGRFTGYVRPGDIEDLDTALARTGPVRSGGTASPGRQVVKTTRRPGR